MSKEKNNQPPVDAGRKKERISVLENIRKRTGLLVGIVGFALVIFIFESLLGSGASMFGNDDLTTVGYINGKKIDRNEFVTRVENTLNGYRQKNQSNDIDDATRTSVIDNVWQQYVSEMVIRPQFDKIGITVGEDEIYDKVVAHPVPFVLQQVSDQSGKVNEQIARPDGSLDINKWKQVIQNLPPEQEAGIRQIEDNVKNTRYFEKFRTIITKGLYITNAEAKEALRTKNSKLKVSFVMKRFDAISDSAVKVTDNDIKKYYDDHSYEFMNPETTRKIEFVAFNVVPSPEDLAQLEADAKRIASEFKGKSVKEDSVFMQQESEGGAITVQDFTKKTMIVRDSSIFTAAPGSVFGPYNEGAYFKVYKLEAVNSVADSARVRHILVALKDAKTSQPKRSKEQAKKQADSLLVLIKANRTLFDTLVKTQSDDLGSLDKGGDYGWFGENKFVKPYTNAGLMGTKGNISVVETEFGYHIIEVLDVSASRHNSYSVAQIFKAIAPSEETNQKIFSEANQFGGVNNTAELFDKGVHDKNLVLRIADKVKEGDRQLTNISGAKDVVRWAYAAKKGEVSTFSFPDKHIVAKLSGIKNKGLLPLDDVKEEVVSKVILEKKADQYFAEFNKQAGNSKNVTEIAAKMGLDVLKSENLFLNNMMVEGIGQDDLFVGTAAGMKSGATSKPSLGSQGVFVLNVSAIETLPVPENYQSEKLRIEQELSGRTDYDVMNALQAMSDIEDHKSRID